MAENDQLKFRRVLLKLSGEGLLGKQQYGIDPETVDRIASEIKVVHDMGAEVCMVIGGGNIFRGVKGASQGMERATADYMGMLATIMNALAVQNALERHSLPPILLRHCVRLKWAVMRCLKARRSMVFIPLTRKRTRPPSATTHLPIWKFCPKICV